MLTNGLAEAAKTPFREGANHGLVGSNGSVGSSRYLSPDLKKADRLSIDSGKMLKFDKIDAPFTGF
jgi:hypothetical protein